MLAKTILTFAGLVASVSAILVTSPTKDQKLDFSKSVEIKWTSVSTDPATFQLVLVDQSTMNPITVEAEVKTSDNKYTLTNFVAPPGAKYKFNFLSNDPMNTGILAQSETFEITKSGSTASSTTEASTTTSTTEASTTTTDSDSDSTSTDDSTSTTMSTSTRLPTASRTTGGSSPAANTANASSTPNKTNAAVALDRTFGVAGGVLAGLLMLF